MNAEDVEALLRATRGPAPPPSIERRVLAAASRRTSTASRALAFAAALLLAAALLVTLRHETRSPAAPELQETPIRDWSLTIKEPDPETGKEEVVAVLSAEEARRDAGPVDLRKVSARIFPGGKEIEIQADAGRLDGQAGRISFEGAIRFAGMKAVEGSIDFKSGVATVTFDIAARFEERAGKKLPFNPKVHISARESTSDGTVTTFVEPSVEWLGPVVEEGAPAFSVRVAGAQGRAVGKSLTITGQVRATLEDGHVLQASQAVMNTGNHSLRLRLSLN